jgi:hypothetical protein
MGEPVSQADAVRAALREAAVDAEQAATQVAAAVARLDEAVAILTVAAKGSSQPAAAQALGRLAAARQRFGEADNTLRRATAAAARYATLV